MVDVGIFFVLLFLLFVLSRLFTQELSLVLYRFTRSEKWVVTIMAILFLPGTFIHELSHYVTAILLGVPAGKMEFTPEVRGNTVKMGSVSIAETDMFRRFLIGIAPVVWGTFFILALMFIASSSSYAMSPLVLVFVLLLTFVVGNTMYSSKRDMEGAIGIFIFLAIVFIFFASVIYFSSISLSDIPVSFIDVEPIYAAFSMGWKFLLVPIGIDLIFITMFYIFLKR